jgi:hypothetical protein
MRSRAPMIPSAPATAVRTAQPCSDAVGSAASRLRAAAGALLAEHTIVLALLVAYLCLAVGFSAPFPERTILTIRLFDRVLFVMLEAYVVAFLVGFVCIEIRRVPADTKPLAHVWRTLRARYLNAERLPGFVLMFFYARVLTDIFVSLKAAIPLIHPFAWDTTFAAWDYALHFGRHPWQLLAPVATPAFTVGINVVYNVWIFVLFGVYIWQAWSGDRRLRERFFISFALAWILLGTGAATLLSSAGPCYYDRVTDPAAGAPAHNSAQAPYSPYEPLMRYLYEVDRDQRVWALAVQEALWDAYSRQEDETVRLTAAAHTSTSDAQPPAAQAAESGDAEAEGKEMLNGISAMPSMHVAMSMLFALLAWNVHRLLGIAFTAFALAIAIGSVHLGWHYAVDGYASAIAMPLVWLAAGRLVDWRRARAS